MRSSESYQQLHTCENVQLERWELESHHIERHFHLLCMFDCVIDGLIDDFRVFLDLGGGENETRVGGGVCGSELLDGWKLQAVKVNNRVDDVK